MTKLRSLGFLLFKNVSVKRELADEPSALLAFPVAASFNLRVQPNGSATFADKLFTPVRFGILLALLVFATFPQVMCGLESFVARDFGFFAYPLAHFQQQCFQHGELPLWNPYNNCGVPFLAQWNTMPLYPPSLFYLTLPLEWSLSFFSLAHLWWAGIGMYFLARRWTRLRANATAAQAGNDFAAAFAGVAFAFNGFTLNLLMWPSHIATFSWLPWVIFAVEAAWREGGRKIFLAAIVGALQMLAGGPETILLTWLIASALWLQQFISGEIGKIGAPSTSSASSSTPPRLAEPVLGAPLRLAMLWRFPLVVALVFALSAAQLLPFLDLVAHAQRESGYTDLRWSMPTFGLANFLVPMAFGTTALEGIFFQHGQYWTSSYYLGLGTLWLALLAFLVGRDSVESKSKSFFTGARSIAPLDPEKIHAEQCSALRPPPSLGKEIKLKTRLLGCLALLALLCALGENTPFYPLVRKIIPQLSFITYPIKFVMVVVFAAPLLAAFALTSVRGSGAPSTSSASPSKFLQLAERVLGAPCNGLLAIGALLLLAIVSITYLASLTMPPDANTHATLLNGISRAAFLIVIGALLWTIKRQTSNFRLQTFGLGLILIAWLDVFTHQPKQNPTVSPAVFELNRARTKLAMQPQPELGGSRVMLSPQAALELTRFGSSDSKNNFLAKRIGYCANANLLDAVPKVDGFFSLTPRHFEWMLALRYSVTNGNWSAMEDFMGVSQTTAPGKLLEWEPRQNFLPLVTAGQKPVFLDDTNTLWAFGRNDFDGGKIVFLPPEMKSLVIVSNQTTAKVLNSKFGNRTVDVEVDAAEPSLVVVAQTYYHNWRAEIDGQPATLLRANVAFQAVQVPAGKHRLHLFYRDAAFELGAMISLAALTACALGIFLRRRA